MALNRPNQLTTAFANAGLKNDIPQSATGSNRASYEEGFPTVTMTALDDGGTPPQGQDFNGMFYTLTDIARYAQAGGLYPYNSAFCTAIGGYPLGAILMSADGSKLWQNQVAGNTNNPDVVSTNWLELCTVSALTAGLDAKLSLSGGTMTGAINSSADVGVSASRSSGNVWACSATRTDTGNDIAFGIGQGGETRGIFDITLNDWLINRNSTGTLQSGGADVILSTGGTLTGAIAFDKTGSFITRYGVNPIFGIDATNNQTYVSSADGTKYFRLGDSGEMLWAGTSMSAMSLPSGTTKAFTLPASQGTYIAPADGWIGIRKKATAVGQYLRANVNGVLMRVAAVTATEDVELTFPVKKGASVFFVYNVGGTTSICNFVYAEGAVWEA